MIYYLSIPITFLLSFLIVYVIKNRLSFYLMDIPNERSSHVKPTPRGGGLGFVLAFLITSFILYWQFSPISTTSINITHIWLVLLPLTVVGLLDDRWQVSNTLRYLVQLVAASSTVFLFGIFPQPWLTNLGVIGLIIAIFLTVFGFTVLVNYYNFMDGLDGLLAGLIMVQLGFLSLMGNQPLWFLLMAAVGGFLWWNWSPAKIFMGDSGSTVLGAVVAIALLNYSHQGTVVEAWSALTIILPIAGDTTYTLICRAIRGENIFQAHRTHLYQRLHQSGWSHARVASSYILFNLAIAMNIFIFAGLGAWMNILMTIVLIVCIEVYLQKVNPNVNKGILVTKCKN